MTNEGEFGVEWMEFNKKDQAVTKQKFFMTEKGRDKFADKVQDKDNFWEFTGKSCFTRF
jgi:hypothetical protein